MTETETDSRADSPSEESSERLPYQERESRLQDSLEADVNAAEIVNIHADQLIKEGKAAMIVLAQDGAAGEEDTAEFLLELLGNLERVQEELRQQAELEIAAYTHSIIFGPRPQTFENDWAESSILMTRAVASREGSAAMVTPTVLAVETMLANIAVHVPVGGLTGSQSVNLDTLHNAVAEEARAR